MRNAIRCLLTGVLIGVLLISPAFADFAFPDVDISKDYAEAVDSVNRFGIIVGDDKGNFNPNKIVTRAEMTAIICRMLNETDDLKNSVAFSDVPMNHWANAYICKATELGVVNGYGNGKFGPSDGVTYEQAVTMVIRAFGGEQEAQEMGGYPDEYLNLANESGILRGVSAQRGEPLTRANIAIIIYNCVG